MPAYWRIEFRHLDGLDDATANVYALADAIYMLAQWSPRVRAKCALVPA